MKKAVIKIGGKQYVVSEGDELQVDRLGDAKKLSLKPLLVINDAKVQVGTPEVEKAEVSVQVGEEVLGDKVVAIRYKAKKRVRKVRGHRQQLVKIKVTKINA